MLDEFKSRAEAVGAEVAQVFYERRGSDVHHRCLEEGRSVRWPPVIRSMGRLPFPQGHRPGGAVGKSPWSHLRCDQRCGGSVQP